MMMIEVQICDLLVELGVSLFQCGYCVGSVGNICVCLFDGYLMILMNFLLGWLCVDRISKLDLDWIYIVGDVLLKEVFMYCVVLIVCLQVGVVVYLYLICVMVIGCLVQLGCDQFIVVLMFYFVMCVGCCLLVI